MTNLEGDITLKVAPLYSLRNWIEDGFKQVKNELGWADYRLTDYESIERWWEIVMSAYLLVSIQANYFCLETVKATEKTAQEDNFGDTSIVQFRQHPWWNLETSWKSTLNNFRLILQPYIFYSLLEPWLQVFPIPGLKRGFLKLISKMNQFQGFCGFKSFSENPREACSY